MGEDLGFRCCAMLIIITSMPTSSVYRVMSERIITLYARENHD